MRTVAARPSVDELHHHSGVLGRNTQDEELRAMYQSVKRCVLGSLLWRCDARSLIILALLLDGR
jgi:hypothetical protein